jgi:choline dehydrogenase-like flavoprotein
VASAASSLVVGRLTRLPDGWSDLVEPAAALGHDLVPLPMAKGAPWMAARRGTEFNSWTSIIDPLTDDPAFKVVTGAHALRLHWAPAAGRVEAVEYLDRTRGEPVTLPGRAFVVAAGAVNSARLLLASTSATFPTGLGDAHGVLGRYLHDHPKDWWAFETDRALQLPAHPVYMTRCAPDRSDPLIARSWTIGLASRGDRPKTYVGLRGTRFAAQVFDTMVPTPDHRVRLDDGPVDALGQRRLRIRITYDQQVRRTMIGARDRLREVFAGAEYHLRPLVDVDPTLRPGESVHYGGTVRMHADPRLGMVDEGNRLHALPTCTSSIRACSPPDPRRTRR